jgi:flagellar basal-body rod protein FlgF
MDNTLYVGLSRQMTLRRELDIVANNIANADTTGFKTESLMVRTEPLAPAMTVGAPKPVKFVLDHGVARDYGQGTLHQTGGAFDLGIEGEGFFKISTAAGERYTRDGRFRMDDSGKLTTQDGKAVLDAGGGEIVIDPEKGPVQISPDGNVSQGDEQVGKLSVVKFDDMTSLQKAGDNLYSNTSNQQPQPAPESLIRQGTLEASNVRPIAEITRMMEVTRTYESVAQMMSSASDLSSRSIDRLGRVQ